MVLWLSFLSTNSKFSRNYKKLQISKLSVNFRFLREGGGGYEATLGQKIFCPLAAYKQKGEEAERSKPPQPFGAELLDF